MLKLNRLQNRTGDAWIRWVSQATRLGTLIILTVAVGVFLILQFIVINQIALAILILVGLIIPIVLVAFEYRKSFREFQLNNCKHNFTISHLRLLFTGKFRGTDPVPTATVAYDLKCPNCNEKDWLIPSG